MILIWIFEYYRHHKFPVKFSSILMLPILISISSCNVQPEPFKLGTDVCYMCKMGIVDLKFGSQIITKKGKVYKFDDIGCMIRLLKSGTFDSNAIKTMVVADFSHPNTFIPVDQSTFVSGQEIKSPMNFNLAAYTKESDANRNSENSAIKFYNWNVIYQQIE